MMSASYTRNRLHPCGGLVRRREHGSDEVWLVAFTRTSPMPHGCARTFHQLISSLPSQVCCSVYFEFGLMLSGVPATTFAPLPRWRRLPQLTAISAPERVV